jgi:cytochrome c553
MRATKWTIVVVLVAIVAVSFADMAVAAKKAKGQDLYKEYCKPCHAEGSENGEYNPMTLIQDQWDRFFNEKYLKTHEGVTDPNHDNLPVTEAISEEDLEKIAKWTIDHAADSEQPMTCG